MNEVIYVYITATFHPDMIVVIQKAFNLIYDFNLDDLESNFTEVIMYNGNLDKETMQDLFIIELNTILNNIIELHSIYLNLSEVSISDKVELLTVLNDIQDLEDYSNILCVLESDLDSIDKLSEIVSQLSLLRKTDIYRIVNLIDPIVLDQLKTYIYNKITTKEELDNRNSKVQKDIINNIRLFKRYWETKNIEVYPAGIQMVEIYVLVGLEFKCYLEYMNESIIDLNNIKSTAFNIYSIILMSCDGAFNPISIYRKYSDTLIDDIKKMNEIDNHIKIINTEFETFKLKLKKD